MDPLCSWAELSEGFPPVPEDIGDYSFSAGEMGWIEDLFGEDEGDDFQKCQKYGIGKVLKEPIKLVKEEGFEEGEFPKCRKYGVGKVLRETIKDNIQEKDHMGMTCKRYGVGKVLKAPIKEDEEGEFPKCRKYGVGKVLREPMKQHNAELEQDRHMGMTCKRYGVGKVLKVALIKKLGEDDDDIPEKKKRRLVELSKEEQESKMRATEAKLRQSYQQTLPIRHSKVVDVGNKSAGAGANNRKKPSKAGTVQQRIMKKIQALKSKNTVVAPIRKLQALWN